MADKICTRFNDDDGFDVGCKLVSKEYVLEAYPDLVPWMKAPALWVWGIGSQGELGTNSIIERSSPVQTVSSGTNWKNIAAGRDASAGVKTDGTLWLWGAASNGQLGNQSAIARSSPVQTISAGTNWKSVSLGSYHAAAIKTDGSLWLWGGNGTGQMGNNTNIASSSPVQTISAGTNWKSVSLGSYFSTSIKTDGTLWSWGSAIYGQLGNNTTTPNLSSPVQTFGTSGTNWESVSAGHTHVAAIKNDGTLWVWGDNTNGSLGNNNISSRSTPVQTFSGGTNWKQVSGGAGNTAAIKTDGTLWLWGENYYGILGTNNRIYRSTPIQTVSGGTNWKHVSVCAHTGNNSHAAAIKTDGSLWLWGRNNITGAVGDNTRISRSSPVQTVSGGTGWRDVMTNLERTLAVRDEGEF